MQFPEGFVEKYEEILGDEARDFLASFEEEAVSAFRVNPLKEAPASFSDPIPQTPWGATMVRFQGNRLSMLLVWFIRKNLLPRWLLR